MAPRGRAGSRKTTPAPTSRARASTRAASPGVGSRTGPARTIRKGWAASKAAAPGCDVVSTVTSPAGRRRQSSQRYDWMPPTLGGKSLVTSTEGIAPLAERGTGGRVEEVQAFHVDGQLDTSPGPHGGAGVEAGGETDPALAGGLRG